MDKFNIIGINNYFILLLASILSNKKYKKGIEFINARLKPKIKYVHKSHEHDIYRYSMFVQLETQKRCIIDISCKNDNIHLCIRLFKFYEQNEDNESTYVYDNANDIYEIPYEDLKELDEFLVKCYIALMLNGSKGE